MIPSDFSGVRQAGPLPDVGQVNMPEDMRTFLEDYLECTSGQLGELEQFALAYESGCDVEQNAASIRRVLHKLKGEAGMLGLEAIGTFCHEVEEAFEQLPTSERTDMLLRFKDWMVDALSVLPSSCGAGRGGL